MSKPSWLKPVVPLEPIKLPAQYGRLSSDQRRQVREQYIALQKGLCPFCKAKLDAQPAEFVQIVTLDRSFFPPNFFKHPVHLQHDHQTGLTEGAVHAKCNAVLFQYHNR